MGFKKFQHVIIIPVKKAKYQSQNIYFYDKEKEKFGCDK